MQKSSDVRKAQMIMLEMLETVAEICESNDIRYWLDAGTLLGCIRHGGFIPWDDDLDIAMPREDFEKFSQIAPKLLPKNLIFQTKYNDQNYKSNIAKIRKRGTKIVEHGENENEPYHQGIFIDIFPFDYYPCKGFVKWMKWTDTYRKNFRNRFKRGTFKRFLASVYANIFLYIPTKISKSVQLFCAKRGDKFFANPKMKAIGHRLNMCTTNGFLQSDVFPLKKEVEFEGVKFFIPNNYSAYLTDEFGADFMTPPPLDKRNTHAKMILFDVEEKDE